MCSLHLRMVRLPPSAVDHFAAELFDPLSSVPRRRMLRMRQSVGTSTNRLIRMTGKATSPSAAEMAVTGDQAFRNHRSNEMQDDRSLYEALANHLDRLPAGFPGTESGVEMKILRRLFTPEEAELAPLLGVRPETPEEIAKRSELSAEELGPKLEAMSRRGLIFRMLLGGRVRYLAAQFLIGIWEFHVNDLDPELIRDMNEYIPHFFQQQMRLKTPQLRTIPISRALPAEQAVMPFEEARRIVMEQEKILVAPCICRKEHQIAGKACGKPLETCLVFGFGAAYYEENGLGRPISREEALEILRTAEEKAMVLQPSNSQKVSNICVCCGCCCQPLKNLKKLPDPAHYVASNYYASLDESLCTGCGVCAERCQMDAVHLEGETARIDLDRCIGCGLCVPTCPGEALHLECKSAESFVTPPTDSMEKLRRIAAERLSNRGDAK